MVSRRRLVLPGFLLVVSGALGGCGSDDADSAVADPTTPASSPGEVDSSTPEAGLEIPAGAPACGDIWTEGAKLPRMYDGCVAGETYVKRDVIECSSGQRVVRFDDAYYAVLGGPVQAASPSLAENGDYQEFLVGCRA